MNQNQNYVELNDISKVFERFQQKQERILEKSLQNASSTYSQQDSDNEKSDYDNDNLELQEITLKKDYRVSRSKKKKKTDTSLLKLKLYARLPDLVQPWDYNSPNPELLIWLKEYPSTVPIPVHWNSKSRYLSNRRVIEKPPYKLPPYIEATKINQIRATILERDAKKTLRQKQREKVRPKSNKMYLDYEILHDAFFKYVEKPPLTSFGDVYYEFKEEFDNMKVYKPGVLSDKLREALGISSLTSPPPWLFAMQRFGPPPAYTNLAIPGVNAPIPAGCHWGVKGWGQIPLNNANKPLFSAAKTPPAESQKVFKPVSYWGEVIEFDDL